MEMAHEDDRNMPAPGDAPHFSADVPEGEVAAWTEIEEGRFMPSRVRGSFQGRALG